MRDLFIFWEGVSATPAGDRHFGVVHRRWRLGVSHELPEGPGEFLEDGETGREAGLEMEGDHLRAGQGTPRSVRCGGRWQFSPKRLLEPGGVGLVFGKAAGDENALHFGLLVGAVGSGLPLRQVGWHVSNDILVAAVAHLAAPEDGFHRRATGEAGDDGYLDLGHGQRVARGSFVGDGGGPFGEGGGIPLDLGRLLRRLGRWLVPQVAADAPGVAGGVRGTNVVGKRPVVPHRMEGSPALGGPRGAVVRRRPVVEESEVALGFQRQHALALLGLGEDLHHQIWKAMHAQTPSGVPYTHAQGQPHVSSREMEEIGHGRDTFGNPLFRVVSAYSPRVSFTTVGIMFFRALQLVCKAGFAFISKSHTYCKKNAIFLFRSTARYPTSIPWAAKPSNLMKMQFLGSTIGALLRYRETSGCLGGVYIQLQPKNPTAGTGVSLF